MFPSRTRKGPIKEVQKAVQRLRKRYGFKFIAHDLRRTAATLMADAGMPENFIPKVPGERAGTTTCMRIAARSARRSKRGLGTSRRFSQTSSQRLGQSFRFDAESGFGVTVHRPRVKLSVGMAWRRPQHTRHRTLNKDVSAAQRPAVRRPTASSGRPHRFARRPPSVVVAAVRASP